MIKTSTSFVTDQKRLQGIYDNAERILLSSVKAFGDRRILTDSPDGDTATLNSEIIGASVLSHYDTEAAIDTLKAFLATQREDGRMADSICCRGGDISCRYDKLTGLCFAEEALSLYYLTRKKDDTYLEALLRSLERFDAYLWSHHDLNFNNCLEIFNESETEEGQGAGRYAPVQAEHYGEIRDVSPFPVESADLMSFDVSLRRVIAQIYLLYGDREAVSAWLKKTNAVTVNLRSILWSKEDGACFDRDYRGTVMDALSINNLFMMYYGAFDRDMAKTFVEKHLWNAEGFATPFPLPTLALGDSRFVNDEGCNFNGQPRAMTYCRAISALEKYGYNSYLTSLGKTFLRAVGDGGFAEQFDPFTGKGSLLEGKEHTPAATAALALICNFFGVRQHMGRLYWGALGHGDGYTSEYCFTWGGDTFRLLAERDTSSGFVGEEPLFTVTNGMRVITDLYGEVVCAVNITDQPLDGVLVCGGRTYSFSLPADGVFDPRENRTTKVSL